MENENKDGVVTPVENKGGQGAEPTKEEKDKLRAEIDALRAEKNRLAGIVEKTTPPEDFSARYRKEQYAKARNNFIRDYNPSEEELSKVEETFKRLDSGAIDADFIIGDLVAAYGSINAQKFVEIKREQERGEAGAAEFAATGAGSFSGDGGTSGGNKISREGQTLAAIAKKTKTSEGVQVDLSPEEAEAYVTKGTSRTLGV